MNETIEYYNENSNSYFEVTVGSNMDSIYEEYFKMLPKGHILDLGCGSGRDSKAFLSRGYTVTSIDGSEAMVDIASKYTGQEVLLMDIENLYFQNKFNGIWACASLLHINKSNMKRVLTSLRDLLTEDGYMYMSFKNRDSEYIDAAGRYFNCYSEEGIRSQLDNIEGLNIEKVFITSGAKKGDEEETWLNVICKRV
ncbi:MAG: class I SAM-dependent methyltransferase [Clostridium sp.]